MTFKDGFVVAGIILCGVVMLVKFIKYINCGIYTQTFKGTSRRKYIHRDQHPGIFWLNVIFHLCASLAMLYFGGWALLNNLEILSWVMSLAKRMF